MQEGIQRVRIALILSLLTVQLLIAESDAFADDFESEFEAEFAESAEVNGFDPLRGYNRMMTSFNDMLYMNVYFPVARGYEAVIPEEGRLAVGRVYDNLRFPVRFANNLLQLKFQNSAEELSRFVVNSTLGIGGMFDPASTWLGLEAHPEDLGQTLGHYGVGSGFHIVLPFLGPSNLRDTLSLAPDWYIDPVVYWNGRGDNLFHTYAEAIGSQGLYFVNRGSFEYKLYESIRKDAVDLYPFLKNAYEQSREKAIEE
ncbi:MAG: VacJ family lipoprotein [Sulfurimonadaceae bacterium]|nr:VacJ family lipoprotein [Sulfurimonadaceae bacterium]